MILHIVAFAGGYGVSVGLGYLITRLVDKKLSNQYGVGRRGYEGLPALVGIFERILYTTVLLAGFKEFIAWWLLVKVGAGWVWQIRPQRRRALGPTGTPGAGYNIYLILNALSIVFGGLGALIIWILIGNKVIFCNSGG